MSADPQSSSQSPTCEASQPTPPCNHPCKLGHVYASLLLRLWLGVRAVQTGIEKFSGTGMSDQAVTVDGQANEQGLTAATSFKEYSMAHYHGVPESLMTTFKGEPLMVKALLPWYDKLLGPALIGLGLTILCGLFYRTSLFLLGLLYISLTWGLILIKKDDGISWLGVHMILIAMALSFAEHNRLSILKKW